MERRRSFTRLWILPIFLLQRLIVADIQTSCAIDYVSTCLSTAIISACGSLQETLCICDALGQASIASIAGPCLLASCPVTEILAIGDYATGICDQWLSTYSLTGSPANTTASTTSAFAPSMTTTTTSSTSTKTSSPGTGVTNSQPTPTAPLVTSTSTATPSLGLSVGAGTGIGVGAFALVGLIVLSVYFFRRRRAKNRVSQTAHEIGTDINVHELPDKQDRIERADMVGGEVHELAAFKFPFQEDSIGPVEADSHSVRAQSRGRMVGTETTAFDFESQKVLITPGLRPGSSRASSTAPGSTTGSARRINSET